MIEDWCDTEEVRLVLAPLTDRQQAFALHYAVNGKQMEAYRAAGYSGDESTVSTNSRRLLTNRKVIKALAKLKPLAPKPQRDPEEQKAYDSLPDTIQVELEADPSVAIAVYRVLSGIRAGNPVSTSCEQAGITEPTWRAWEDRYEDLRELTLNALSHGVHKLMQDCVDIADSAEQTREGVQHARLMIETRIKIAGFFNRAFYGHDPTANTIAPKFEFHANFLNALDGGRNDQG